MQQLIKFIKCIKSDKKNIFKTAIQLIIIIFSLLFLYIGNKIATRELTIFADSEDMQIIEAKIVETLGKTQNESMLEASGGTFVDTEITFKAFVTKGANKNEYIDGVQSLNNYYIANTKEVEKGDKILMASFSGDRWYFVDYVRIDKILILSAVFMVLLFIFGRLKGLAAIFSLCLTCTAVFAVFIPSLLSGSNIYISASIVCVYSIIVTLFIVNGVNKKSLSAVAGCLGGVILIGILTPIMDKILGLTGVVNEESQFLLYLPTEKPIDLQAIIFAGIIVGAVGALMDVAMSISSALWEVNEQAAQLSFRQIFKSGINIGKDVMGTMINTLVLAYIGSSLSVVLLLVAYSSSIAELMNRELVIVEFLQALVGSIGILLTMPLTSVICAALYSQKHGSSEGKEQEKDSGNEVKILKDSNNFNNSNESNKSESNEIEESGSAKELKTSKKQKKPKKQDFEDPDFLWKD